MNCPECKAPMLKLTDLWGRERWAHPDTECAPLPNLSPRREQDRTCGNCGSKFKSAYRRKGCSEKCIRAIRIESLKLARKFWKRKGAHGEPAHVKRLRTYWQSKAQEQDRRWAA